MSQLRPHPQVALGGADRAACWPARQWQRRASGRGPAGPQRALPLSLQVMMAALGTGWWRARWCLVGAPLTPIAAAAHCWNMVGIGFSGAAGAAQHGASWLTSLLLLADAGAPAPRALIWVTGRGTTWALSTEGALLSSRACVKSQQALPNHTLVTASRSSCLPPPASPFAVYVYHVFRAACRCCTRCTQADASCA